MSESILIDPAELVAALSSARPPVVLDVRWRLDRPDGYPDYRAAHIPGALYVDLVKDLGEPHGDPLDGRHPLPSRDDLQAAARRWGIDDGDSVVVYDDLKNLSAARAWWLLRFAGLADVRLLDGALRGWIAAGHPVEAGDVVAEPGTVTLSYGHLPLIDIDAAASTPARGVLLDARPGERYRGDSDLLDPRAGHIPGAVSAPASANVDTAGRFLPPAALQERFEALGVTRNAPIAVYCGSGVAAAHEIAALSIAGYAAALYPGSWSQWSRHPERPITVGDQP